MKTLLLNRHAEAANPKGIDDFNRPLTDFGIRQAETLAAELFHNKTVPALWVSSPALRAATTAGIVVKALHVQKVKYVEDVYEASEQTLLRIINTLPDECDFAALTGHNPGISYLFYSLCNELQEVPPCTALLIKFHVDSWSHVSAGTGTLAWYMQP